MYLRGDINLIKDKHTSKRKNRCVESVFLYDRQYITCIGNMRLKGRSFSKKFMEINI